MHLRASVDIPTKVNIHRYQCNNPICYHIIKAYETVRKKIIIKKKQNRETSNTSEPHHDKTNKMTFTPNEDSDQPWHPHSLIRVFAVRMKKQWVLSSLFSALQKLWSDWANIVWSEFSLNAQIILLFLSWGGLRIAHVPFHSLCMRLFKKECFHLSYLFAFIVLLWSNLIPDLIVSGLFHDYIIYAIRHMKQLKYLPYCLFKSKVRFFGKSPDIIKVSLH